ncbi:hypothetical protein TSUD_305580 [Trifolium subterraneum]|uniref:RNase H type-1 domain-containing protein n=1 Tax=Trifolium subterraneum TaxID=3900 RepID=A0A2Z6LUK0_TRISU|nr:hypothetical protein TSUD_305580 [Trifolium subterraneum]
MCNVSWRLRFHEGFAKVLPRVQSDHHPIIVISDGETNMGRNRPFRYEAAWGTHENFRQLLQENWIRERDLVDLLSNLTNNLTVWNKEVFGNIFRRKKELLARLNGIQNSSNYGYSNFLETLENELQQQLTTTLYQEECLWYQKSRGKWITDGDRNTKYYHSKTIVRRRRNKIVSLRSETGDWIEDQEILINMAMNFYINLYHEDKPVCDPVVSWTTYPQNLETEHHKLSSAVQYVECKQALFDMSPHKAPGEDGYPALFFQQNWDIVAESVHHFVNQVWSNPSLIPLINNTLLVLIPKVDKPEFIAQFRPIALYGAFYGQNEREWIFNNMEKAQNKEWKTIFMITCWHLWMWRNKSIFEEGFRHPNNPTHVILKMSMEIDRCEQTHLDGWNLQNETIFIGWKQPREGWFKLNCDGAHKSSIQLSGCGGLIRNNDGICVSSFARKIGSCDALHAEMWGMYIGMDLARRKGVTHLQVESDSKVLVDMVTGNCKVNGRIPTLVRRIRDLKNLDWQVQINHTWREGNRPADWLANFSLTLNSFDLHTYETPPRELQSLIFYDFSGACMPRSVRLIP